MPEINYNTKIDVDLGLLQMPMVEDPAANLVKALQLVSQAAQKGAQIICLPELFRSPYFPQVPSPPRDYSEPLLGEVSEALSNAAATHKVVLVGGSIFEATGDGKGFNTTLVYGTEGELIGKYRKTHIPNDPGFYEQCYFSPGDTGYQVFDTPWCKIAVLICYDQWFPEAARAAALKGAEIIFYPTAIGNVEGVIQREGNWQEAWENVQRGHAIANNVVVAAVNRVGTEGHTTFWGGSFVCDAFGKTLIRGSDKEELVIQRIDLNHGRFARDAWRFRVSRRPETYRGIVE
jgi:predicted amidohydrolase